MRKIVIIPVIDFEEYCGSDFDLDTTRLAKDKEASKGSDISLRAEEQNQSQSKSANVVDIEKYNKLLDKHTKLYTKYNDLVAKYKTLYKTYKDITDTINIFNNNIDTIKENFNKVSKS